MREKIDRLFIGRNGIDQLNIALLIAAVVCWVGYRWVTIRILAYLLRYVCLLAAAFCVVRALSVNVERRRMENQRVLSLFRARHNGCGWWAKMEQRKEYKIFKCPSCGVKLRVPRGKGKIKVTCRQCGATIEEKS